MSWFQSSFSLDRRSLGLMRILTALAVLVDLVFRSQVLVELHSDAGAFPRSLAARGVDIAWVFPHFWVGDSVGVGLLFVAHAFLAILLFSGIQVRWVGFLLWFFQLSITHRTSPSASGGDLLLVALLFWGIFLPWDETFTKRQGFRPSVPAPPTFFGVASVALTLQVAVIYLLAFWFKSGSQWRWDLTAVQASLLAHHYATSIGATFKELGFPLKFLTAGVLVLEALVLPSLLITWRKRILRQFVLLGLAVFHAGLIFFLDLGAFPFASLALLAGVLPSRVWGHEEPLAQGRERPLAKVLALLFLTLMLWRNLSTAGWSPLPQPPWSIYLQRFQMQQSWTLFTPDAGNYLWWVSLHGESANKNWDLFPNFRPYEGKVPEVASQAIGHHRWTKYLGRVLDGSWYNANELLGDFWCRRLTRLDPSNPPQKLEVFVHHVPITKSMAYGSPTTTRVFQRSCGERP